MASPLSPPRAPPETPPATSEAASRVALVAGASRGMGAALALALGARGWHVLAVARTAGGLEELDDRIRAAGGSATLAPLDLTDDNALRHLCRSVHDRWGHLDLWAQTAMLAPPLSPAGHVAIKDWDRLLAVVLRATGVMIPMVEPLLRAAPQCATALFFDDPARLDPDGRTRAHFAAYGAAKAGQIALAEAWARECAALGPDRAPRVVIDRPAPMPTGTRARFFPGEPRDRLSPCAAEAERCLAALGL